MEKNREEKERKRRTKRSRVMRTWEGHAVTYGSLLGVTGKWCACGWSVVRLDYDGELGLLHGLYITMDAELEVNAPSRGLS